MGVASSTFQTSKSDPQRSFGRQFRSYGKRNFKLVTDSSALRDPDECLVLGSVDLLTNEFLHIGRTLHAGQARIEDEFGYPRCGLDLNLQDVGLGWEEHPQFQLLGGYLVG